MTEHEVGEMLGILYDRYPTMPVDERTLELWTNSFETVEAETAFNAVAMWVSVHTDYPNVADLHDMVYRIGMGKGRARQVAYEAYVAECKRLGRTPNDALWRQVV